MYVIMEAMKRDIEKELLHWKDSQDRMPLQEKRCYKHPRDRSNYCSTSDDNYLERYGERGKKLCLELTKSNRKLK